MSNLILLFYNVCKISKGKTHKSRTKRSNKNKWIVLFVKLIKKSLKILRRGCNKVINFNKIHLKTNKIQDNKSRKLDLIRPNKNKNKKQRKKNKKNSYGKLMIFYFLVENQQNQLKYSIFTERLSLINKFQLSLDSISPSRFLI